MVKNGWGGWDVVVTVTNRKKKTMWRVGGRKQKTKTYYGWDVVVTVTNRDKIK